MIGESGKPMEVSNFYLIDFMIEGEKSRIQYQFHVKN